ncbi:cysteine sulfinic acid decarboxylase-like [Saccoglossus kowalevskii]|uniref:Glutamate decarboxylase-like protein 1-like n=1 Tax=Saccoglossus kowalevskii TaxID=10224 RepID=A0ABM0M771_SACKO|nr:PREDICTED: glutamate decarboxylase-like protein 1-like [Saccoglossus kowalevskii]
MATSGSIYITPVSIDELDDVSTAELSADQQFLQKAMQILFTEGVIKAGDRRTKVVEYLDPHVLKETFDLEIKEKGVGTDKLLQLLKDTLKYSVRSANPRFFNQLYAGQDAYGLVGQWMTDTINASMSNYEISPVFNLMEVEILKILSDIVGYEKSDGIFCPGGSIANMYGISMARYHKYGEAIKTDGLSGLPRLILFTSKHAHYSISKGAAFMGFGTKNVYTVEVDERGRMIPEDLEKQIELAKQQGHVPLFVSATCGTTVYGAYDPVDAIADLCEKHDIWLHVDACWGASALMSQKWRHLLHGVNRSNSVAWCPHKMMGVPFQCSAFLVRDHIALMHNVHCSGATYLFQQDKFYDLSYDTGDKVIQSARKVDAFKLWLMFKAKGYIGFEQEINIKFANSRHLAKTIEEREGFQLVVEPTCTNVCFWYIPPCLRNMNKDSNEFNTLLGKVAPIVKERMLKGGTLMIGYQPLDDKPNFFRQIFSNAKTTFQDVEFIVDEIDRLGDDITISDLGKNK